MAWQRLRDDDGRTIRLAPVNFDSDAQEQAEFRDEEDRRAGIARRRMFYSGTQYDRANLKRMAACGLDPETDTLPEHERKHAYSTQIEDSVDFIADQISNGFQVVANNAAVGEVLDAAWAATDVLTGGDEDELTCDPLLVEAFQAGDVPYEVRWDPINGQAYPDFWESEQVFFIPETTDEARKVIREQWMWVDDETTNGRREVREQTVYEVVVDADGEANCRRQVWWDADETPKQTTWLGIPFLPWGVLRGVKKGLRTFHGTPLISDKAMDGAQRYDAVEQLSFLIARYNSHGNLAVIGDGAQLQVEASDGIHKDVADVLTFPGGTDVETITLPTDPQMIEHQRTGLAEAIYNTFGLTRVEPDTMQGLGQLSGYALEILNRKSEATIRRIRRQWSKDWVGMCGLLLDMTAYRLAVRDVGDEEGDQDGLVDRQQVPDVDPEIVFGDRRIEIVMGTGYIVDAVAVRDDYTAGLISRQEALRQRGRTQDQIDTIVDEIADEDQTEGSTPAPAATQVGLQVIDDTERDTGTE